MNDTESHSKAPPTPNGCGYPGGDEEPTQAYAVVRRGELGCDNEDGAKKATRCVRDPRGFLSALLNMGIDQYVSGRAEEPTLIRLAAKAGTCRRCELSRTRTSVVFGEGNDRAELILIGEAPGEEEDLQGRPFVGRAGKLLDRMIERIGLRREDVFICNVLKCRPPGNRDPLPDEVEACKGYLFAQIELIRPKLICTLGRHAYNTLLGVDGRITKVRGTLTAYRGAMLLPTYHPSYLLRNEGAMREAYEDMEKLKGLLASGGPDVDRPPSP
ncbi:MAG: uracil-DNA glycosylase [Syntrophorhabdales bacterium]|jgi:DNA polymerase